MSGGNIMKNELLWTKTILSVYRYLERICGAIDKIVMKSALGSCNIVGQSFFYNNVYSISQKIIDLSERKVSLINLKILTEEVLEKISKNDAKLLIKKYFDGEKCREIAQDMDISMRTLFRKLESAQTSFSKNLKLKGYDDEKIFQMLKNEKWIVNVYERLKNKDDEVVLSSNYLERAASM